jgi:hypothetical protein
MKALAAILFSLFFLLTTMQELTFLLLYKFNEKAITEKYCVNKAKPMEHCNGKCHLNKTIAKAETETTQNPFSVLNLKVKEVEIYFQQFYKVYEVCITAYLTTTTFNRIYNAHLPEGVSSAPIKPPAVLG